MLNGVIFNLVLGYLVGELQAFGSDVNWTRVKTDLYAKLQALIPWKWVEAETELLAGGLVDAAAAVLQDQANMKALLLDLAGKDFTGAVSVLKAMLSDVYKPTTPDGEKVLAALKAA